MRTSLKLILVLIFCVLISQATQQQKVNASQEQKIQADDTDNMLQLSKLIISTIQKYDDTGKGILPYERYHEFLHQIFVKGNKLNKLNKQKEQVPEEIQNSLRQAIVEFKKYRYEILPQQQAKNKQNESDSNQKKSQKKLEKKEFIELQEFYMDLIKHFSEFLSLQNYKEKFRLVDEYFFVEKGNFSDQQKTENSQTEEKMEL